MVTAEAIFGRNGEELLPSGATLDRGLIEGIQRRGLRIIRVSIGDDRTPERICDDVTVAEKRLQHIFRGTGGPAREELRRAVLAFRVEQAS